MLSSPEYPESKQPEPGKSRAENLAQTHLSVSLGTLLVGFSLGTIAALIADPTKYPWGEAALFSFLVAGGMLLAAYLLGLNADFLDKHHASWGPLRGLLAGFGLIMLIVALELIVLPRTGLAQWNWRFLAMGLLAIGVLVPEAMILYLRRAENPWLRWTLSDAKRDQQVSESQRS
jgi:hypothetical protein